jgi:hypothetical protein
MRVLLPVWVGLSWSLQQNLIVRAQQPAPGAVLVQLDDLDGGRRDRAQGGAFLTVETSSNNYQAWMAIEGGDSAFARRVMDAIRSDSRANCSGRVAGSPNVKERYRPDFPMVRIVALQLGRMVTPAELEDAGLVAPPAAARAPSCFHESADNRGWPDYERCSRGAPLRADGLPDRSSADFLWCKWALERSNSLDAVRVKLLEVSEKAREEWKRGNLAYVRRTVDAAADAVYGAPKNAYAQR